MPSTISDHLRRTFVQVCREEGFAMDEQGQVDVSASTTCQAGIVHASASMVIDGAARPAVAALVSTCGAFHRLTVTYQDARCIGIIRNADASWASQGISALDIRRYLFAQHQLAGFDFGGGSVLCVEPWHIEGTTWSRQVYLSTWRNGEFSIPFPTHGYAAPVAFICKPQEVFGGPDSKIFLRT